MISYDVDSSEIRVVIFPNWKNEEFVWDTDISLVVYPAVDTTYKHVPRAPTCVMNN